MSKKSDFSSLKNYMFFNGKIPNFSSSTSVVVEEESEDDSITKEEKINDSENNVFSILDEESRVKG